MFEIRMNGRKAEAQRLTNLIMEQHKHRLEKRDTIGDFWQRRLHDMQLRDDPVESAYSGGSGGSYNRDGNSGGLKSNKSKHQPKQSYTGETDGNNIKKI